MLDPSKECIPIGPTSASWRCSRQGTDGCLFVFGELHYSHGARGYHIEPVSDVLSPEVYTTFGEAAAAPPTLARLAGGGRHCGPHRASILLG
jgi:hypothetical protein